MGEDEMSYILVFETIGFSQEKFSVLNISKWFPQKFRICFRYFTWLQTICHYAVFPEIL